MELWHTPARNFDSRGSTHLPTCHSDQLLRPQLLSKSLLTTAGRSGGWRAHAAPRATVYIDVGVWAGMRTTTPLQLLDLGLQLALELLFLRGRIGLVHLLPNFFKDLLALKHRLEHTVDFALQLLCRRHGG